MLPSSGSGCWLPYLPACTANLQSVRRSAQAQLGKLSNLKLIVCCWQVTQEDAQTAIEEQYGGDGSLPPAPGFRNVLGPCLARFSSAYMLLVGAA